MLSSFNLNMMCDIKHLTKTQVSHTKCNGMFEITYMKENEVDLSDHLLQMKMKKRFHKVGNA